MILELLMPQIDGRIDRVRIDKLDIAVGDSVTPSSNLLELTAGLDFAGMHGCPPTTKYRMTSGETAYVRRLDVTEGASLFSNEVLAILSSCSPSAPMAQI